MIPLRDDIPSRTFPAVNIGIIVVCSLAWLVQLASDANPETQLTERLGMIPARLMNPDQTIVVQRPAEYQGRLVMIEQPIPSAAVPDWLTLLTCVFLHGGWMHLIGNMWFLFIFGDNVEDRLGHVGYLLFYLGAGVLASAAHLAFNLSSPVPTVGASGAIAGVMGAYFLLYPKAKVLTLIPLFLLFYTVVLPAPLFLGIWFFIQFLQGAVTVGSATTGVAWWAHIGGFAVGFGVAALLVWIGETKPPVAEQGFASRSQIMEQSRWPRRRN